MNFKLKSKKTFEKLGYTSVQYEHSTGAQYLHFIPKDEKSNYIQMSTNFKTPVLDKSGLAHRILRVTRAQYYDYPPVSMPVPPCERIDGDCLGGGEFMSYLFPSPHDHNLDKTRQALIEWSLEGYSKRPDIRELAWQHAMRKYGGFTQVPVSKTQSNLLSSTMFKHQVDSNPQQVPFLPFFRQDRRVFLKYHQPSNSLTICRGPEDMIEENLQYLDTAFKSTGDQNQAPIPEIDSGDELQQKKASSGGHEVISVTASRFGPSILDKDWARTMYIGWRVKGDLSKENRAKLYLLMRLLTSRKIGKHIVGSLGCHKLFMVPPFRRHANAGEWEFGIGVTFNDSQSKTCPEFAPYALDGALLCIIRDGLPLHGHHIPSNGRYSESIMESAKGDRSHLDYFLDINGREQIAAAWAGGEPLNDPLEFYDTYLERAAQETTSEEYVQMIKDVLLNDQTKRVVLFINPDPTLV